MEQKQLKSFKDLMVWQKSADLAPLVYDITEKFPKIEPYGLIKPVRKPPKSYILNPVFFLLIFLYSIFYILNPTDVSAATLYLSPSSGTYGVGVDFSVAIKVSSTGTTTNAAEANLMFNPAELRVVGISRAGSIFTLWPKEPSFSNTAGTIEWAGGTPTAFTGTAGRLITITFRGRKAADASINFVSGAILAADGKGTNILTGMQNGRYIIRPIVATPPPQEPGLLPGAPAAPIISSTTHPNPEKWYPLSDVRLTWNLTEDVDAVRLLTGRSPTAIPVTTQIPPISERELTNLEDGIWYFSARLRNRFGWGEISRFRFQIDTQRPDHFEITKIETGDPTDPRPRFKFEAKDRTSGIDHFEIRINGREPQIWRDDGTGIYQSPLLGPGSHTLTARAIDRAGNSLTDLIEFKIQALEAPIITEYPQQVAIGESFMIQGTTKYPNTEISIWFERKGEMPRREIVNSDPAGNFVFWSRDGLSEGVYSFWAEVIDARGARSMPSEKVTISVEQPAFWKISFWAMNLLAVIITLVALIFILIFGIWYSWHKFILFKRKLKNTRKEVHEVESVLHKEFASLKKDIRKHAKALKIVSAQRQLTAEEKEIMEQFTERLSDAEKSVGKEIGDVEKEIEDIEREIENIGGGRKLV